MLLGAAMVRIGLDNSGFMAGISSTIGALGRLGTAGPLAAFAVVGGLAAAGVAAVKLAGDYQQSMNSVQALTGASTTQMAYYNKSLDQLAMNAGVGPTELSKGLYNVLSASYKGATAMQVLTLATEDAKIGMTSSSITTDALTKILRSFGTQASDITRVNGEMLQTVTLGQSSFAQYASTIVKSASAAVQFHVSMETMNAAWSTLTGGGLKAAQASTDFSASLRVMYGNIGTVSSSLQKNGIAFNETKFNAASYGDKVLMLNKALQEAAEKHVHITGVTVQAAQAIQTISKHIGDYNSNLATLSNKQQMAEKTQNAWAITQQGFNQKMSQVGATLQDVGKNLGTVLLPALGNLLGVIPNIVGYLSAFQEHSNVLVPILAGIGAVIAVVLVPAVWSLAAGVIAATWPLLLIGAVVAGLVAIFMHFYQTSAPFKAFIDNLVNGFKQAAGFIMANFIPAMQQVGAFFMNNILPVLRQIGAFLLSTFAPVWQQLVSVWQGSILPALKQLWGALQPLLPVLQGIGAIVGTVLVIAFGLLVGIITGVVKALAGFLSGLATAIGGVVQVFTGIVQVISGIVKLIYDLLTGNFSALGADLGMIWQGIINIFQGAWNIIVGLFQAAWGFISGLVSGFVQGIVGFFQWLADTLVGHSIIPDLLNAITGVFQGAFSFIRGLVSGFVSAVVGFFQGFASTAASIWNTISSVASNIWNGLVSAVQSIVLGFVNQIVGKITGFQQNLSNTWNAIKGTAESIWNELVSSITGIVTGLWHNLMNIAGNIKDGVTGVFQNLFNALVGHSIVPDMTNSINASFDGMNHHVTSSMNTLKGNVSSSFSAMKDNGVSQLTYLTDQGSALFQQLQQNGTTSMANLSGSTAGYVNEIANYLAQAQANFNQAQQLASGKNLVATKHLPGGVYNKNFSPSGFASGIENFAGGLAYVHAGEVLANLAPGTNVIPANRVSMSTVSISRSSSSGGSGGTREIHIHMEVNGRQFSEAIVNDMGDALVKHIRVRTGMRV